MFSIILCCYNSEKYIEETLNSILSQTYKEWELIIVDDGSTDNTSIIIKNYINDNNNNNIKYFYQENKGFASARNLAVQNSNREWIVIIDHDDICLPNRLLIHKRQIENNSNAKLFFADTIHFKDNKTIRNNFEIFNLKKIKTAKYEIYFSLIKQGCFIDSESVVFSKSAYYRVGKFNENYKYIADYDFFIKMGKIFDFDMSIEKVSKWRIHETQATNKLSRIYEKEYILLLLNNLFSTYSLSLNLFIIKRVLSQYTKNIIKLLFYRKKI
tara:strand:- start:247 stop:1056 length:810 start_codon:yes stop_codon:yes gene_type:complete